MISGGDFFNGFRYGAISVAFNHVTHALMEGGDKTPLPDGRKLWELSSEEFALFANAETRSQVTGTGQITPTDSPIDWVLGAWKTPFQAADDVAVLGFAKIAGGNSKNIVKISDKLVKNFGIDAHKLKQDFLGVKALSRYDLYKNTNTGEILIFLKGGKCNPIQTGEFIK